MPKALDTLDTLRTVGILNIVSTALVDRSSELITDDAYVDVIVAGLRRRLREVASDAGSPLAEVLGDVESLADRVAAVVPAPSPLAAAIGPVYRQATLAVAMGTSRQAVADLVKRGRLLALTTADGHVVIPSFQLGTDLRPLAGLPAVLKVLPSQVVDSWTLASWLRAPQARLAGASMIQHLGAGGNVVLALAVAESARRRWAA